MKNIKTLILCSFVYLSSSMASFGEMAEDYRDIFYSAYTNVTYVHTRQAMVSKTDACSRFATNSRLESQSGWVVHIRPKDKDSRECAFPYRKEGRQWIAFVDRELCNVYANSSIIKNASAIIFYEHVLKTTELHVQSVENVVTILMPKDCGTDLQNALNNGTDVWMSIQAGRPYTVYYTGINRTSVFFVSISFIVLTIASLAWLVFYYVQRMRHAYAKERFSRHLYKAAKKAVNKMPLITVKSSDLETRSEQCAICMDSYSTYDVIRQLPCKHVFHKSCVDPWLVEQRSCPMCKLDILIAFGLQPPNQAALREASARLMEDDVPFSLMDSLAFRGRHTGEWIPVTIRPSSSGLQPSTELIVTVDAADIAPSSFHLDSDDDTMTLNNSCTRVSVEQRRSSSSSDIADHDSENDPLLTKGTAGGMLSEQQQQVGDRHSSDGNGEEQSVSVLEHRTSSKIDN